MAGELHSGYKYKYGFVGGGNMGEALLKGVLASGLAGPAETSVFDPDAKLLERLGRAHGVVAVGDNAALARSSAVIVLAVKPQHVNGVLAEIRDQVGPDQLVISIAAGVSLAEIQAGLNGPVPVIRTMPNTPALVMAGAAALSGGANASRKHLDAALALFAGVGTAVEVEEKYLDIVTGLGGSGPAYVFTMIEALADGAVRLGLPRRQAYSLAGQTVLGAAKLFLESGKHPGELKDMVVSPGGTTAAGLFALEKGAFRALLMEAVAAAAKRAGELGGK
ncbi:MAG: pyrroline-5-carboxylate reductase [Pseudomonadota bacterium]